jgi:hypothetical protein
MDNYLVFARQGACYLISMKKLILLSTILLSGCSMTFTKPDSTEQSFQKDWTECQVMSNQAGMTSSPFSNGDFLENCMIGKGWERE